MKEQVQSFGYINPYNEMATYQRSPSPLNQFLDKKYTGNSIKNHFWNQTVISPRSNYLLTQNTQIKSKLDSDRSKHHSPTPTKSCSNAERFQEIQDILKQQNTNLRQHTDYLINQVRKSKNLLKKYKTKLLEYQQKIEELEHQNDVYRLQYLQIKEYVFQGINKMENIVKQKSFEEDYTFDNNFCKFQQFDKVFSNKLHSSSEHSNPIQVNNQLKNSNCKGTTKCIHDSTASDLIQDLNGQFDTLMSNYKMTRNQQSRKKCIQLAKQIKDIKNYTKNLKLNSMSTSVNTPKGRQKLQSFQNKSSQISKKKTSNDQLEAYLNNFV